MSTGQIIVLFFLLGLIAALLVAIVTALSERTDTMLRGHRVTLHTRQPDDQTIHGLLVSETRDRFVLVDATYVTERGEDPIPDRVVVFKPNVSWLQEHGEPATAKQRTSAGHVIRRLIAD